jgi:hypothetical protein
MPTYGQAAFLPRAVASLQAQTRTDWELVVVDDGSPDDTRGAVEALLGDDRVRYRRLERNRGLGAALNEGLRHARGPLTAYLPSDDVLHADHLATLLDLLEDDVVLVHSGCRPAGHGLQLVQVLHRRGPERWVERDELETDDLERLLWRRLRSRGRVAGTERVTCEWTQHPGQRHRAIREGLDGGLNVFRHRYRVGEPLRFAPSDGALTDEVARYRRARQRPSTPRGREGLRILLVGELAYNPDRVLALEERGHELLGLWLDDPLGFTTVGPLPFGHVRDLPRERWRDELRAARPDVIYALLNWRAVPLAHEVLTARLDIPFVFHFKEAPQRSLARGDWPRLAEVVLGADACLFASEEERAWFHAALPALEPTRTRAMDGDLPRLEWLAGERRRRLSEDDGEVHTVLAGRPYGWTPELREGLRARGLHVHVRGGPQAVGPERWVEALSRYDAGWMHPVRAANGGDVCVAAWDDLNLPARLPMLLAAGLPLILPRNPSGAVHAAQRLAEELGVGVLYDDLDELAETLRDGPGMARRRARAWQRREELTFERHVDELLALFRAVVGARA